MKQFGGEVLFLDRSDINTDEIIPAKYLTENTKEALKPYLLEDLKLEGFNPKTDILGKKVIITRENFGCGSSREHAPATIKANKVMCVIAKSFARIFYRNAINIGLPIIECDKTDEIDSSDTLDINFEEGIIKNKSKNKEYKINVFPDFIKKIIDAGGLMSYAKEIVK